MLISARKVAGYAVVGLTAFASLLACAQGRARTPAQSVTVCYVHSHAKELNGRRIRLSGVYTTDRLENASITDPHCPKVWVAPYDSSDVDAESMKRFDDAVAGDLADSSLRVFSVEFVGKYIWRPKDRQHNTFYIEKVLSFKRLHNVDPWKQQSK